MYANNIEQLLNFTYFIIIGMILGIIFDIFRILRRIFKTSDILTNIEDILFGVMTGIILLSSIFLINNGQLRLYIFIGIFVGILIYLLVFSKFFIKINVWIINYIKKIILFITKPFIILLKWLKKLFLKPISFIIINLKHFGKKYFIKFKKTRKFHKKAAKEEGF